MQFRVTRKPVMACRHPHIRETELLATPVNLL